MMGRRHPSQLRSLLHATEAHQVSCWFVWERHTHQCQLLGAMFCYRVKHDQVMRWNSDSAVASLSVEVSALTPIVLCFGALYWKDWEWWFEPKTCRLPIRPSGLITLRGCRSQRSSEDHFHMWCDHGSPNLWEKHTSSLNFLLLLQRGILGGRICLCDFDLVLTFSGCMPLWTSPLRWPLEPFYHLCLGDKWPKLIRRDIIYWWCRHDEKFSNMKWWLKCRTWYGTSYFLTLFRSVVFKHVFTAYEIQSVIYRQSMWFVGPFSQVDRGLISLKPSWLR